MSLIIEKITPNIYWFQTKENIILDVHIKNFKKENVIINNNNFKIDYDNYNIDFEFFDNILQTLSSFDSDK